MLLLGFILLQHQEGWVIWRQLKGKNLFQKVSFCTSFSKYLDIWNPIGRFVKIMAMVWAGSQVTKLVRAGG